MTCECVITRDGYKLLGIAESKAKCTYIPTHIGAIRGAGGANSPQKHSKPPPPKKKKIKIRVYTISKRKF